MAIGERLRYFRQKLGLTQKQLGVAAGFPERSADVRLAQYETGTRTPKAELTQVLANALDVAPEALNVPDIDTYIGLMHTLFALEDIYGLKIYQEDCTVYLKPDPFHSNEARHLYDLMLAWNKQKQKLDAGEISQNAYDHWRYHYPKYEVINCREQLPE